METIEAVTALRRVRVCVALVIAGLLVSGVTAFPLVHELDGLVRLERWMGIPKVLPDLCRWLEIVAAGLDDTARRYPFLAYGTDWLAFAHVVLAILFIGPFRDPVRNRWVIEFGLIACAGVLPLAWIAGPVRGIPVFWRVIDSSFGVVGGAFLLFALRDTKIVQQRQQI
jgi:hypothetical protein